jgi:hypothetical protein
VFISYSRKDYYFAESLTFHLLKREMPAWLDVKDLRPGVFWNRDLEAALDAASCIVLLASPNSVKSRNVRAEWERAKQQGKRIVVALLHNTTLPAELLNCDIIDFRGSFTPALNRLLGRLQANPPGRAGSAGFSFALPPWVLTIALTLFIPLASYFLLADWTMNTAGPLRVFLLVLLPGALFLFAWALCFSFLRRRMGMTHLLLCFAFGAAWIAQAFTQHQLWMMLIGALPLIGLGILLIIQPEDLLRWTPTGKAWGWFRARRTPKIPELAGSPGLKNVGRFYLLCDPLDEPAAAHLRQELVYSGGQETATRLKEDTAVLLLTAGTRIQWLEQEAKPIQSKILAVVGTRIGLPAELDWLWQREWIDFRHWDLNRLNRSTGLLRVPEAVTGTRFPFCVRLAHHLLCALLALSLLLTGLADPVLQNVAAVAVLGLWIWYIPLARRLLRRTVSGKRFYRFWPIAVAAVCLETLLAVRHLNPLRISLVAAFLIVWPILFLRNRPNLAFWFPSTQPANPKVAPTLACKRDWQTLIWLCVYLAGWYLVLGLSTDPI